MRKDDLTKIGAGFYVDSGRSLYFSVTEFIIANGLPDTDEVRRAIWEQVRVDFGLTGITELPDA